MTLEEKARESSINACLYTNMVISQPSYEKGYIASAKENREQLEQAKTFLKELINIINYLNEDEYGKEDFPIVHKAEQFLNGDGCPDCLCEDCTKEDCTVRKLGLVEK